MTDTNAPLSDADLEAIEAWLAEHPPPWSDYEDHEAAAYGMRDAKGDPVAGLSTYETDANWVDLPHMAAGAVHVAALLAEVRRLRAENAALRHEEATGWLVTPVTARNRTRPKNLHKTPCVSDVRMTCFVCGRDWRGREKGTRMSSQAAQLIQQSITEDSIVHAEYSEALALALQIECEDSAESRSGEDDADILEYWGEFADAVGTDPVAWRVHLRRSEAE